MRVERRVAKNDARIADKINMLIQALAWIIFSVKATLWQNNTVHIISYDINTSYNANTQYNE